MSAKKFDFSNWVNTNDNYNKIDKLYWTYSYFVRKVSARAVNTQLKKLIKYHFSHVPNGIENVSGNIAMLKTRNENVEMNTSLLLVFELFYEQNSHLHSYFHNARRRRFRVGNNKKILSIDIDSNLYAKLTKIAEENKLSLTATIQFLIVNEGKNKM